VGKGHATLSGDMNTFAGETSDADVADGAYFSAPVLAPERMSGVFDDEDAATTGQFHNGIHVDRVPVVVDDDNRLGLLGEDPFDGGQIDVTGRLEHVGIDRASP
jgi:hypothetical protein